MPVVSGISWRFAGLSPLPRLVSKIARGLLLFPKASRKYLAGFELLLERRHCDRGGHGLEYIVVKHEMLTIRSSVSDIFVMCRNKSSS
jgi:hypothetical protein